MQQLVAIPKPNTWGQKLKFFPEKYVDIKLDE